MSSPIDLPGGTATLKDKSELTNREMKQLSKAQLTAAGTALHLKEYGFDPADPTTWSEAARLTADDMDTIDLFQRTCVFLRLVSWDLKNDDGSDRPLPQSADEVDNLPMSIYTPLTVAAVAGIKFGEDEFEVSPDPKAPIANSTDSS